MPELTSRTPLPRQHNINARVNVPTILFEPAGHECPYCGGLNPIASPVLDRLGERDQALAKWPDHMAAMQVRQPFCLFGYSTPELTGSSGYMPACGQPLFDKRRPSPGYRSAANLGAELRADRAERALREALSELARANRIATMGRLTASITHEISQPTGAARNNASAALNFLNQDPPDLDEARKALACVVANTDRTSDIIHRIRDHINKDHPRSECFDLNDAINDVLELVRNKIAKQQISVRTRVQRNLPLLRADRVQIQQVALNLILNAVEAMSAAEGRRELLICADRSRKDGVVVAVQDTGPGIAADQVERVFEPYYTTKSDGVGIGLSICRSIIEAHGGRLWAERNDPRGAAFKFCLAAAKGFDQRLPDQSRARAPGECRG